MWFKNILVYQLAEKFPLSADDLNQRLEKKRIIPCLKTAAFSHGWSSPFGDDSEVYVHSCNGYFLFAARKEEKILPASVIRDALTEKIKVIEQTQERKIYRREKLTLRDEVTIDLLMRAFIRKRMTFAYLDPTLNCLIIDTANRNRADEFITLLRETVDGFMAEPLITNTKPSVMMTDWLNKNYCPQPFFVEDSCQLVEPKKGTGIIRCDKQDLAAKEIHAHLQSGKQVTSLAMSWQGKLGFTLTEDFSIKRVQYLDLLTDTQETNAENAAQQLDADFALMSGEITQFVQALIEVLGGINAEQNIERGEVAEV